MTYENLIEQYLNISYEERIQIAHENAKFVLSEFQKLTDERKGFENFLLSLGTFFVADGEASQVEYKFFQSITGIECTYEDFMAVMAGCDNTHLAEGIDNLIDSPRFKEVKTAFVKLGLCIITCDKKVTDSEKWLITKYID